VLVVSELESYDSAQNDKKLFRVAVRLRLRSGRAANVELAGEDLEVVERSRGQQHLPPENPERKARPVSASQHPRLRRSTVFEEISHADAESVGDAA
jgi:hypothetical protein